MSLLDKLFPKKQTLPREMPSWEEIVAHMQDRELTFFADTVVRVIPSKNRDKRIVILKSEQGYFKTLYEEIHVWDEDEWNYCSSDPDSYPAYWVPANSSINSKSFYGTEEDAFNALVETREYNTHFI